MGNTYRTGDRVILKGVVESVAVDGTCAVWLEAGVMADVAPELLEPAKQEQAAPAGADDDTYIDMPSEKDYIISKVRPLPMDGYRDDVRLIRISPLKFFTETGGKDALLPERKDDRGASNEKYFMASTPGGGVEDITGYVAYLSYPEAMVITYLKVQDGFRGQGYEDAIRMDIMYKARMTGRTVYELKAKPYGTGTLPPRPGH